MSQHISGNVSSAVSQEYGEFMTIDNIRVRKSLIQAYSCGSTVNKEDNLKTYAVALLINNAWLGCSDHTDKKEVDTIVERLDWIFKKDYGAE